MSSVTAEASEYRLVTEGCGVVDRCQRGKLALSGGEAKSFLQGQVSNDVEGLASGTGCYAAFLTPKGKMLGDLRVLDTGEELLLDCERMALQGLFNMIRRFSIGYDVVLSKRTVERGLLSVLGPAAESRLGLSELPEPEHSHLATRLGGVGVRAIRTDVGVDLLCEAGDTSALAAALAELGIPAVSEETAECLRVERGRPRYGVDLDDSVIPQEAGLNARAVSFTKGCYVGQETVARLYYRGKPNRHLRGLRCSGPVQTGDPLRLGDRAVGQIGSAVQSPRLGSIALALLRREATPGSEVQVGADGVSAEVVELPFS
jgi:folate-binding protein YgfZ